MDDKGNVLLGMMMRLIWLLFIGMTGYLFLMSIFSTCMIAASPGGNPKTFYLGDHFYIHLLVIASVFLVGSFLHPQIKKWGDKLADRKLFLLAAYGLLGLLFVRGSQLYPISDQRELLTIAEAMKEGDYSAFYPGGYMNSNPHQKGILLYICLFVSLFGKWAYLALQIANVIWLTLSLWFLGKIVETLWKEERERKIGGKVILASILFFPVFFFITYIYGNIPGMLFAFIGIWLELRFLINGRVRELAASVFCIGLAVVLKMNCQIIGIGMFLYALCALRYKKFRIKILVFCTLTILSIFSNNAVVDSAVERIYGVPDAGGTPMNSFIAMGLQDNEVGPGWWNGYTWDTYRESGYNSEIAAEKASRQIRRQIEILTEDPGSGLRFFIKKFASGWNNPTYQGLEILAGRDGKGGPVWENLAQTWKGWGFHAYMNIYQSVILAGCLLYLWFYRKKLTESVLLFPVIIIGGCVFHMFWEMKSSYILPYFLLMIPLAMVGYMEAFRKMQKYSDDIKAGKMEKMPAKRKAWLLFGAVAGILLLGCVSRTELFIKTVGLCEGEESYEEIYYREQK